MSNLIIGACGSMGVRYQAIFKHLDEPYWCVDLGHSEDNILSMAKKADRIVLCTPTETHFSFLEKLIPLKVPILCEKPIVTSSKKVEEILLKCAFYKTSFSMMFQYGELVQYPHSENGKSSYNYFRTGKDGLVWDCLQIIALANGDVKLENNSPIWKCVINGTLLNSKDMDSAYVRFIEKWIAEKIKQQHSDLLLFHRKTEEILYEHTNLLT